MKCQAVRQKHIRTKIKRMIYNATKEVEEMNNKFFRRFYLVSLAIVIAASFYPIYMGIQAAAEMFSNGAIPMEHYPKYIIPYTPVSIAVFFGVLLIPVFQKISQKFDFLLGTIVSTGIFFVAEKLMETKIFVQAEEIVILESWQMSMCYVPPEMYQTRTWQAVDVLLGGYSPAFKLHFYIISVVLIISLLNCFYGFARMIRLGDYKRKTALVIQAVTGVSFLGMCIWACFTSFYRTGEITVSVVSAILMAVFFVLLGVTIGVFTGSFTLGKSNMTAVALPAFVSAVATTAMYIGEMILLNGNLYRFGSGLLFDEIGELVVAPVDLLVILLSGGITALICKFINLRFYSSK